MKFTTRDASALLLGLGLGALLCRITELSAAGQRVDWPATFQAFAHIAQIAAFGVAGWWTYNLFVKQRLGTERANLEHIVFWFHHSTNEKLVRVVLEIRNIGSTLIAPPDGTIAVHRVVPINAAERDEMLSTKGRAEDAWPLIQSYELDFRHDKLRIEPGEIQRYPFDFLIPADTSLIQVYSKVRCGEGDDTESWDETTIHKVSGVEGRAA